MNCLLMGMSVTGVVAGPDENDIEGPSFVDVLTLKSIEGVQIAPDGSAIAYTVKSTDWDENQFDTEIWLVRDGEKPFQLTNTKDGSSSSPSWSPDSKKILRGVSRWDIRFTKCCLIQETS